MQIQSFLKKSAFFLKNKLSFIKKFLLLMLGLSATLWFLYRVIPKPSRVYYPCMQASAPLMSAFVIWLIGAAGTIKMFMLSRLRWQRANYAGALLFFVIALIGALFFSPIYNTIAQNTKKELKIWYKVNEPLGVAKGIFPGRVVWGYNPKIATWDMKTGFWWEDKFNNQDETDLLFGTVLLNLTGVRNEKKAWDKLFVHFNKTNRQLNKSYSRGETIFIKINQNNATTHQNNNEINANPVVVLALLQSIIEKAGIPQHCIIVSDPSRYITDNIFDKCSAVYPYVKFVDNGGGKGRIKSTYYSNAIPYSIDNGRVATGLSTHVVDAEYVINLALMKGHVGQGITLCAKNFFGCTSIESDWRKNHHSFGFSQSKKGEFRYSIYPDFLGHKDLGAKTMLFLIDGIYSHKFVDGVPAFKWNMPPFNGNWPNSIFASQDGVAIDAVVLDFALAEWPDAPDMMYSDYAHNECALAHNPPSGIKYDPERDGTYLKSLGVSEHWNNPIDKQYTRNLKTGNGIELIYKKIE